MEWMQWLTGVFCPGSTQSSHRILNLLAFAHAISFLWYMFRTLSLSEKSYLNFKIQVKQLALGDLVSFRHLPWHSHCPLKISLWLCISNFYSTSVSPYLIFFFLTVGNLSFILLLPALSRI